MRQSLIILFILGVFCIGNSAELPNIGVSVVVNCKSVPDQVIAKTLQTKLERALTDAGIPSSDEAGLFLVANIMPISEQVVEGGMRKIRQANYELDLELLHPIIGTKFGTHSLPLKGAGYDKNKTLMDAVRKINSASSSLTEFLHTSIYQASAYYANNFDAILSKARVMSQGRNYDSALTLLWTLPVSPSTSEIVHQQISEIYAKIQREECQSIMQKANNAYALKNYTEAIDWLNAIDLDSPCGEEAKALTSTIGAVIRAEEKEQQMRADERERRIMQMVENENQRRHELDKHKIDAVSSVARAFLGSLRRGYFI